MGNVARLRGAAILVVEDDALIALDLAFLLEDAGATVLGPVATSAKARETLGDPAREAPVACALLDFDLGKETSAAIAKELHASGVPVVFYTGDRDLAADVARAIAAPVIEKPSRPADLLATISDMIGDRSAGD